VYIQEGIEFDRAILIKKLCSYVQRYKIHEYQDLKPYLSLPFSSNESPCIIMVRDGAKIMQTLYWIQYQRWGTCTAVGVISDYKAGTIYMNDIYLLVSKSLEDLIFSMEQKKWWREIFIPKLEET
jgi:hypothetical protein